MKLLLLLLFASAACAQQTWDYSDGNSTFDGQMVLSTALAANGTQNLSPESIVFQNAGGTSLYAYGSTYVSGNANDANSISAPVFQVTTVNGAITAWDIVINGTDAGGTNSPEWMYLTVSSSGDSFSETANGQVTSISSASGSWVDPPVKAPELSIGVALSALTLLIGALLVFRSKKPCRHILMPGQVQCMSCCRVILYGLV